MRASSPLGVYTGDCRQQISFPLGGIGSGCIGLAGSGRVTGATLRSGEPDAPAAPVRLQHAAARSVVFSDRVTLAAGQELVVECAT